ncbi:DUF2802 domain-containing protein [Pinirhizobacter soli]|uniref:DUF2802 domain-containing protein n=1 Tax=Pinirhizobacter soli TaxID=2786953 RepID=UPI00202A0B9B|nr:DUF2802 domain-containing protein [Pinirhizobacter soli]
MNYPLTIAFGLISLVQLAMLVFLYRRLGHLSVGNPAPAPAFMAPDPDLAADVMVGALRKLDLRIDELEVQARQVPVAVADVVPADRSYMLAQRLARQGASAQQIAETCGIFPSEAELLQRLHGGTRH